MRKLLITRKITVTRLHRFQGQTDRWTISEVETLSLQIIRDGCWVATYARATVNVPLTPAFAFTDFKCQRCTLQKTIVDLAGSGKSHNSVYVMLSRVQRLEDLIILRSFNESTLNMKCHQLLQLNSIDKTLVPKKLRHSNNGHNISLHNSIPFFLLFTNPPSNE